MERNTDFPPYAQYGFDAGMEDTYGNNTYNPIMQYEQAYMYYRYMTQMLEYKIKLREYEKPNNKDRRVE